MKVTSNIQWHQHKPGCHVVNKTGGVIDPLVTKTGGVKDPPVVMNEADVGIAQSVSSTETDGVIDPSGKVTHDNIVHLPDHLKGVYKESIAHLNHSQAEILAQVLGSYSDVFAESDFDLGNFTAIEHAIDTGDAKPIKQHMRRTPACFANEEEEHLTKMLKAGVIQESCSDWASSPVLIRKRDGTVRWCIDYRKLNDVTVKDTFPLPLVEDCLDTLAGNTWFSKLDANSAYWQVKVKEEDRKKTAFLTKFGLFEHVKMGFGLTNAPATFSRVVSFLLKGLTWKTVLAFLDDILVLGKTFEEHVDNLCEVLKRFRAHGMKLKPRKCLFLQKGVEFLGRNVTGSDLSMTSKDTEVVRNWPVPTSSKDVERFLGLANYHRSFVKTFADLAQPLYSLTGNNKFHWGEVEQQAFDSLKSALTSPPVLALPNTTDPFILDVDASQVALGAELSQVQDGVERVISYSSCALTPEQKNYCTTRKELLAIVKFTRQYRYYLLGKIFTVRTDHSSLTWLLRFKEPQGQLARWIDELSQYHMVVCHRAGVKHGNADALSRLPDNLTPCSEYISGLQPADLPCGGCPYCTRAHNQWAQFTRDVDDVTGLAVQNNRTTKHPTRATVGSNQCSVVRQVNLSSALSQKTDSSGSKHSHNVATCHMDREGPSVETIEGTDRLGKTLGHTMVETVDGSLDLYGDTVVSEDIASRVRSEHYFDIITPRGGNESVISCSTVQLINGSSDEPSCWGFSYKDLATEQAKDPELEIILRWLQSGNVPSAGSLFLYNIEAKNYWLNKDLFQLVEGVLFRKKPKENDQELLLVIPDSLKETAMLLHHDIPTAGHQGVARTKAKLKEKFFWFHLSRDIESYVLTCNVCNKNKKNRVYGRVPLTEYQAGAPMERVHIDFIGPLPKTKKGNEHCLMMVDQFTKWVECVPLPSQRAEETARAAIDNFFSRFGFPFQLFSDQGRNFDGKLFEALCKALHIHKARTTPYRPSSNGQVERFNRTLMDAVRCFLGKQQDKWDTNVQQIAMAIRSAVNRSTGFTPNMLMLGREVNTPAQLMFPGVKVHNEDYGEYVNALVNDLQTAHNVARSTLNTSLKRMKKSYDLIILLRPYDKGDAVYILSNHKGQIKEVVISMERACHNIRQTVTLFVSSMPKEGNLCGQP